MKTAREDFFIEGQVVRKKAVNDNLAIIENIEKIKVALNSVYSKLDIVTEPELIDSYIYELKAIQLKYQYLLQQAKELGIIAGFR
jgi:hypothetical protein